MTDLSSQFTFLFTDIEGSSRLWEENADAMAQALARHDTLLNDIFTQHGGDVFKTMGDSVLVAFHGADPALQAVIEAQKALTAEQWETARPIRVRAALHRGPAEQRNGDYFGPTLNRTARLLSAGHGGQTLLSRSAQEEVQLPDGATLRDLGERRLRDLARPERIFQLVVRDLPSEFPPLRSLEVLPNNLPAQLTNFIGREKEVRELKERLVHSRLVTLTGPGGTGKTRLSVEVATELLEKFADGVWLVELATLSDPALVAASVAAALGAHQEVDRSIEDSLLTYLRTKRLLLLLDNCEHLVAACARLAERLLQSAPHLRILASSREGLAIAGESIYPVPSLSTPEFSSHPQKTQTDAALAGEFEAVRLFVDRAAAAKGGFELTPQNADLIARICWRLDGIPLAIELAAARVKALPLAEILRRIDDRFHLLTGGGRTSLPRQQTLTALIDWSYDLLTEKERMLLRRLAVFARGRTLEAIEEVCSGNGVERGEILDLLQQLIDKSLVSVEHAETGGARYFLLESVWDYSETKLGQAGEMAIFKMRHLEYFLRMAELAEPRLRGREQAEWLENLTTEHINFRLALEWAAEAPEALDAGMRLAGALIRYWEVRNHLQEGREHLAALLQRPEAVRHPEARAKALGGAGRLAWCQDDIDSARTYYTAARDLYRSLGRELESSYHAAFLGFTEWSAGDLAAARPLFQAAAEAGKACGDARLCATALSGGGTLAAAEGDLARARAMKEESLSRFREMGDKWIVGLLSWSLSRIVIAQADFEAGRALLAECAMIGEELGNEWSIPYVLEGYGDIALAENDPAKGAQLYAAASVLRERLGLRVTPSERPTYEQSLRRMRSELSRDEFTRHWPAGLALGTDEALRLARSSEVLT